MKTIKFFHVLFITAVFVFCMGCKKYLDKKPDNTLALPVTLLDLQALLDNYFFTNSEPLSGEVSSDDYYLTSTDWAAMTNEDFKRMYIWESDRLFTGFGNDWSNSYKSVFYCNTVLEQLEGISENSSVKNNIKGQALFFRGKCFLQIAWIWSLTYNPATSGTDLGIPLRLHSDFNESSVRSSVAETYDQILRDLKEAAHLLQVNNIHPVRASKAAAYGMLARTYLSMGKYANAKIYSDSCLLLKSDLLDFNTLNASEAYPIPQFNKEVILEGFNIPTPLSNSRAKINDALYQSYLPGDLRKTIFFKNNNNGTFAFKGSYEKGPALFAGIATDEIYLIRAECYARSGYTAEAMQDLNTLLIKRWKMNQFIPLTAGNAQQALSIILSERQKELVMRGLRWADIKRLNLAGANIIMTRNINNQTYTLPPNDLRYALAIPEEVIARSGMLQNPR